MGFFNPRAICPSCGGKIHTQPKGVAKALPLPKGPHLLRTGTRCQHCRVELTGKINRKNRAILAEETA